MSKRSQVMMDKALTSRLDKTGSVIGQADDALMLAVNRSLMVFRGIAS